LGMIQMGTNYTLLVSALLISATLLFVNGFGWLTLVPMAISLLPGIALLRLWRKIERQDRMM